MKTAANAFLATNISLINARRRRDGFLPLTTYREAVQTRLPGASFILVPDVGHAAMVDDPGFIVRTILSTTNRAVDTEDAARQIPLPLSGESNPPDR